MKIAFLMSSDGDANLAIATVNQLINNHPDCVCHLIPMTATTKNKPMPAHEQVIIKSYDEIQDNINDYFMVNQIHHAFIGVPSNDNPVPFDVAKTLSVPVTIAYEYMFHEASHVFWKQVNELSNLPHCDFAVPLEKANNDLLLHAPNAKSTIVGHVSLDKAMEKKVDPNKTQSTRSALAINDTDDYVFVSGSSQNMERDKAFLTALLNELSTGNYPNLKIRFGVHPGVSDADLYLQTMLSACDEWQPNPDQFKVVLNTPFSNKLKTQHASQYLHEKLVPGPDAAEAADKVAQAVPGALLNEAAFCGIPSYFHAQGMNVYLPDQWFSANLSTFFAAKRTAAHSREDLKLSDKTPALMAACLTKH